MCSLAPCRDALGLGAASTSFLGRRRGVAAVAPAAPKRGRDVDAASSALQVRMEKELVALQGLLKRAKLLPRSAAAPAENSYELAPPPRRSSATEVPVVSSQPKAAMEASNQARITAPPAANSKQQQQQQRPVQRAAAKNPIAEQQQQQRPVQRAAAKTEAPRKQRPEEELARAAGREEFRQMLLEMEKSVLPDETIYPEDLEELGIFEHAVTRTRKQAWLEDHGKRSS